eukprot:SAG11_NODE_691_length_7699_cov_3.868026_11_plen_181_part_00
MVELVALPIGQLVEGSDVGRRRSAVDRGTNAWEGSFADPAPPLSHNSAWHRAGGTKQLILVSSSLREREALRDYFGGVPRVKIVGGDILLQEGSVDAFVSPANTIGNMDGGIDRACGSIGDFSRSVSCSFSFFFISFCLVFCLFFCLPVCPPVRPSVRPHVCQRLCPFVFTVLDRTALYD